MEIKHIKSIINLLFNMPEPKRFFYKIPWQISNELKFKLQKITTMTIIKQATFLK